MLGFTAVPCCRSRYERHVQAQFPNSRDVLGRVVVNEINLDIRVVRAEGPKQIE